MGVIKQFNYVQGANQLYVEDFANISNSANNALAGLPWTTPLSICNAYFSGSGPSKVLKITPDTLVVVNGIVFGSDVTVQMTSSQYLYAVCEYDTSQPRQEGESEQYYQAVVRKIKVSDSPLSDTDLSNASVFPGIGNYQILSPNFSDSTGSIQVNSDGSISPFKSVIPDNAVTAEKIADGAIGSDGLASGAVTQEKIADGAIGENNIANGAVTQEKIANGSVGFDQIADGGVGGIEKVDNIPTVRSPIGFQAFVTALPNVSFVLGERYVYVANRQVNVQIIAPGVTESGVNIMYICNEYSASITVKLPSGGTGDASFQLPANKTAKIVASVSTGEYSGDTVYEVTILDAFNYKQV